MQIESAILLKISSKEWRCESLNGSRTYVTIPLCSITYVTINRPLSLLKLSTNQNVSIGFRLNRKQEDFQRLLQQLNYLRIKCHTEMNGDTFGLVSKTPQIELPIIDSFQASKAMNTINEKGAARYVIPTPVPAPRIKSLETKRTKQK